jgi:O-antigen ligase
MLGLIASGLGALFVMPKRPRYLAPLAVGFVVALQVTGPELWNRYVSAFADQRDLDYSAQSRIDLWRDCLEVIQKYPVLGVGPDHFPRIAAEFGWPAGKEAHSLWLQVGAEIGIPGLLLLAAFYLVTLRRTGRLGKLTNTSEEERWAQAVGPMVAMSLTGFVVAAQFVTMEGLETPLYIVAIAVATLRTLSPVASARVAATNRVLVATRARVVAAGRGVRPEPLRP